jgi:hypothetical protein
VAIDFKDPKVFLPAAGVGIALVTLLVQSKGSTTSSGGGSSDSGGAVSASALASETNNYNNDAASVETSIVQAEGNFLNTATTTRGNVISSELAAAQGELGTIEQAQTSRFAQQVGLEENAQNNFTSQANTTTTANAQVQETQYNDTAQEAETKLNDALAQNESNNAVTADRIGHSSSLASVISSIGTTIGQIGGAITGIGGFGFGGGSGATSNAYGGAASPIVTAAQPATATSITPGDTTGLSGYL